MNINFKGCLVFVGIMVVLAMSPSWAAAVPTASLTVNDLLQGGTIQVGDKLFYGFHDYVSNGLYGAASVDPASISVSPLIEGDELGLYFASANFFVTSGQEQDTHFEFFVKVLDESKLISDNTLQMTASVTGPGRVSIAEVVNENDDNGVTLANKLVYALSDSGNQYDHKDFLHPASIIQVSKDIALVGGNGGQAFMSDFSQTFSQTPEPATLTLLALGGLVLLRFRRK